MSSSSAMLSTMTASVAAPVAPSSAAAPAALSSATVTDVKLAPYNFRL